MKFAYQALKVTFLLALTVLTYSSCQQKIHGLDNQLTPLAELKLSVQQSDLEDLPAATRARLRFGLVWLGINIPSTWCAEKLSSILLGEAFSSEELATLTQLSELCRNPLGVTPLLAGPSVAIENDTSIISDEGLITQSITFTALPPSEVLIGTPDARIAYASLVIFEDINENGVLDLGQSMPPIFWDEQEPRRGRDDNDNDGPRFTFDDDDMADQLYSSSFNSLLDSHQRLVFREGRFLESYFYPLGGCTPPPSFSFLSVEGDFQEASCTASPIDESIVLTLMKPSLSLQEGICQPADVWRFQPPQDEPDPNYQYTCLSPTELAASDPEQNCKNLSIIQLLDCPSNEPNCTDAEWDFRDQVPDWWPCAEGTP